MDSQSKSNAVKNFSMLAVALMLGAVAVFFSNKYINERINEYRNQLDVKELMTEVVVPKRNLLRGEVLGSQDLALRSFPAKYVDSNAVTKSNYNIAIGQKLDFDIDEGKPLLWAHLSGGVVPTFSGKVEDGYRALTIPVNEINSISGFLQPNDRVDLFLTYDGGHVKDKITFPFMQNLHVLATGVQTVVDKTGRTAAKRYNTITVQVTPLDAKRIILAQEEGKVTATLRHPDDHTPMSETEMKVSDILGDRAIKRVVKKAPAKKKSGIEFIIGGA